MFKYRPGPKVVAAVTAFAVLVLTFFGVLDGLPAWAKGIFQFAGTAGGIYLGYLLQAGDAMLKEEARGKSAQGQLVALAESVNFTIEHIADRREDLSSHATAATLRAAADAGFSGIDNALRGMLRQARAAADNWDHVAREQNASATSTKEAVAVSPSRPGTELATNGAVKTGAVND